MSEMNSNTPKSQSRHRSLYKTSPNWQQIYRKQCLSRLNDRRNETRSRLIEKFRNIDINDTTSFELIDNEFDSQKVHIVDEVMQTVWNQYSTHLNDINESDITDFMEQIRQELLTEETNYWEEVMEWRKREELEWLLTNRDSVVCFFCQKSSLKLNALKEKTELICLKCRFHYVNYQFPFSLQYLRERMDQIVNGHSALCANTRLTFNYNKELNNICVSCNICPQNEFIFQTFLL